MAAAENGFFPLFISIQDAPVLVAGGGRIALRRVEALLSFGAAVTVIAPELLPEFSALPVQWIRRKAEPDDVTACYRLVIAATSDRETNRLLGARARTLSVPVSVADARAESTFYFPAIIRGEGIVAGLISENGENHRLAAEKAALLRQALEQKGDAL